MQIESTFMYAPEPYQSCFRNDPKVLNTVHMIGTVSEFVLSVLDTVMLFVTRIDQAITGFKSICVHDRFFTDFFPDNGQKLCGRTGSDDLGVDLATSFYQAKNNMFTMSSKSPDSTDAPGTEVTLVYFDLTSLKRTFCFTERCYSLANRFENPVDCRMTYTDQLSNFLLYGYQENCIV